MSLIPTSLPEVLIDDSVSPPVYSRWNAAWNPYVFEFTRKDSVVTAIANSGGRPQLTLSANVPAGTVVGDQIWVETELYKGYFTIHLIPVGVVVIIDTPYIGNGSGVGYLNYTQKRPRYYTEVSVNDLSGSVLGRLRYTPLANGIVRADVSGFVQSLLSNTDGYNLTTAGQQQPEGMALPFTIEYQEFWRNSNTSAAQLPGTYYAVNGAFQVRHPNNGNYFDFVMTNGDKTKKFLSAFDTPTAYAGAINTLAFIWDDEAMGGEDLEIATHTVYSNAPDNPPPDNQVFPVSVLEKKDGKINEIRYSLGGVSGVDNRIEVYVWLQRVSDHARVSEQRKVKIKPASQQACNALRLRWLAPDGSWAQYLFEGNYRESLQVDPFNTYQQAFDNISELEAFNRVLKKRAFVKFQIGMSGLDANDAEGIKTILYSPQVYQIINEGGFSARLGVIIEPGTFSVKPAATKTFDIEFSVVLPEIFNQGA
jgi:hypothetical protein